MKPYRKYTQCFLTGMQNSMEYRANFFITIIGIFVPILIQYFVWSAVYKDKSAETAVFGYTFSQMLTYSVMAGFVARLVGAGFHYEISNDIKNGSLNKFVVQPISYFYYRIFCFIGDKSIFSAIILGMMAVILIGLNQVLEIHIGLAMLALFLFDLFFAVILNFLIFFCVSTLAFWVIEVSHVYGVVDILVAIFSGSILPLDIFGDKAMAVFKYLPFSYTTYFLTNILSSKLTKGEIIKGLTIQAGWILLLSLLANYLWKEGMKKFEAVGG